MLLGNVFGQRFVPIIFVVLLILAGIYLMVKTWKNRQATTTAITVVISLLSLFMIFGGLYVLIFTLSFGMNT
jgi:Na+/H+ antiporter NhaC